MARAQHAVLSTVVVIIQKLHNEGLHFQGRTMQSPTILLQGHPTRNVIFEVDILATYTVATMDFNTSNFTKHVDI